MDGYFNKETGRKENRKLDHKLQENEVICNGWSDDLKKTV